MEKNEWFEQEKLRIQRDSNRLPKIGTAKVMKVVVYRTENWVKVFTQDGEIICEQDTTPSCMRMQQYNGIAGITLTDSAQTTFIK